eukprot:5521052-Amphidinium_carterae.1
MQVVRWRSRNSSLDSAWALLGLSKPSTSSSSLSLETMLRLQHAGLAGGPLNHWPPSELEARALEVLAWAPLVWWAWPSEALGHPCCQLRGHQ